MLRVDEPQDDGLGKWLTIWSVHTSIGRKNRDRRPRPALAVHDFQSRPAEHARRILRPGRTPLGHGHDQQHKIHDSQTDSHPLRHRALHFRTVSKPRADFWPSEDYSL
jgi:hypothetical protein